jgi:hypothetical protein
MTGTGAAYWGRVVTVPCFEKTRAGVAAAILRATLNIAPVSASERPDGDTVDTAISVILSPTKERSIQAQKPKNVRMHKGVLRAVELNKPWHNQEHKQDPKPTMSSLKLSGKDFVEQLCQINRAPYNPKYDLGGLRGHNFVKEFERC